MSNPVVDANADPAIDPTADSTAEPAAPLSVAADLTLTVDGTVAEVNSTGQRLFVEFASVPDAVRAFRAGGVSDSRLERLAALLETTDLTVEVRVRDRTVAVVGAAAHPGVLSRRLDLAPVEIRLGGGLGAVGRELATALATLQRSLQ